jgi:hypothetical protein
MKNPSSLRKINVEIVFAKNPALRGMFTHKGKELEPYLRGIDLTGPEYHECEIVGIDLTGPSDALCNFHNTFLIHEEPEVYTLSYQE